MFRDRNSGPLGYLCVALVRTGRDWASSLLVAMDDQSWD